MVTACVDTHVHHSLIYLAYSYTYHFAWADQREKQGYKSDVSLKAGIHLFVFWENIPLILTYNNLQAMPLFI